MIRVFRDTSGSAVTEALWSFSYVDWQGRKQVSVGTESRQETQGLAERVQAEHDVLRRDLRPKVDPEVRPDLPVPAALTNAPLEPAPAPVPAPVTARSHRSRPRSLHSVRVGEQLVETSVITQDQLDEALEHQNLFGGRIIDILIQLGHLTAEAFLVFMGNRPGIPRILLDNYSWLPKEVLDLVPVDMAIELEAVPIDRLGKMISVAMVCPVDLDALERIQEHTGLKIRPLLCSRGEFQNALRVHYGCEAAPGRVVRK